MGCSVRVTINMALTQRTGVFAATSAVQPVPTTTVAQTPQVQQNQNFDMTACVLSRSPDRNVGEGRKVFSLELADGSLDEASGKVQTISLSVFAKESEAVTMLGFVEKSIDQKDPVTFFNVKGSKNADQNAHQFASAGKGFSMIVADSPHASEIRARASELYNLAEKAPVPQTQWSPNECFASQSAIVTSIKFLKQMGTSPATGIEEIDLQPTLWQLNWIQITEPPVGTPLRTKDGSRLWFSVVLRDYSGTIAMYITEAAALRCSKQPDAASFETAHSEGRLSFPITASAKILRKKGDDGKVDYHIVECEDQDYACAPTVKALELLNVLSPQDGSVEQPADTFLPASLADIRASMFYPWQ